MPESLAPGVYIDEIPFGTSPIQGVSTSTTGFVGRAALGPLGEAVRLSSFADWERAFGGLQSKLELGYAVAQFFENGGVEGWVVRVGDESEVPAALAAFDAVDSFSLLSVPGCVDVQALAAALAYCDRRRGFLVVDPPTTDPKAAQDLAASLRGMGSSNAALYFPPVTVSDPLAAGAPRSTPPGGTVAGVIARTDTERGVWAAPAGVAARLQGVLGLEANIDEATSQSLAGAGVNSIRSFPAPTGPVVWGARTISSDDRWKYVPVRRLSLFIEESLDRGLRWAVSEPNDEPLWMRLCMSANTFLLALWNHGALQGTTSQEAFFVKCGRDVMTPADLQEGRAVLLVGFAPMKPAEFVLLRIIVQVSTQTVP